ncbi:MAG: class I SAM-dependent DNA methyltransferase, partial [Bifidobacterium choerinum]
MSINTTQLERFAATARTRLMGAVGARLDMALSAGSPIRVDEPGAAGELQHQVDAQGRDALVEQYAYRWFNRIIALRYMDVMGFTGLPVVSPASMTDPNGTPEILAAAKRGEYDPDIFEAPGTGNGMLRKRIQALLDGGTGNPNAQADAYGLLIQAACRYWHQYMPFMFPDTNSPAGRVDEL